MKFIYEIVQKKRVNVSSIIFNSYYKDGYRLDRLPEYKYHSYLTYNKETCLLKWFNEYKEILNNHLNNTIDIELYNRQIKIIIKLAEIKEKIKQENINSN